MRKPTEHTLERLVLLAALLFMVSGTVYFIVGLRAGPAHPEAITGAGATCIYYGRDGLQCWPEFEGEGEGEAIVQDLPLEQAEPTGARLRI